MELRNKTGIRSDSTMAGFRQLFIESLVVYLSFVLVSLFLVHFLPFDFVDMEEIKFGDLPAAFIDGYVTLDNLHQFQQVPREGSMIILGLPHALVMKIVGPSLFGLKVAGIVLLGLWAVVWYVIGRKCLPEEDPILIGALFAIPFPLMHIAVTSGISIFSHMGASIYFGVIALLLWHARSASGRKKTALLLISGFIYGVGAWHHYSILPLTVGFIPFFWPFKEKKKIFLWVLGALPGLILAFSFFNVETVASIPQDEQMVFLYPFKLAMNLFTYGAGLFGNEALGVAREGSYISPLSSIYGVIFIVAAILGVIWRKRKNIEIPYNKVLTAAVIFSFFGFLVTMLVTKFEVNTYWFDGLRYLYPMVAPVILMFLLAMQGLPKLLKRSMTGALVVLNLMGVLFFCYPFEASSYSKHIKGYQNIITMELYDDAVFLKNNTHPTRSIQNAFWLGAEKGERLMRSGLADSFTTVELPMELTAQGEEEFWRGIGFSLAVSDACRESIHCVPQSLPIDKQHLCWQGVGVRSVWLDVNSKLDQIPETFKDDLLWGLGRGEKWDNWFLDDVDEWVSEHSAYRKGKEEGWIFDMALDYSNTVHDYAEFDRLIVPGLHRDTYK